MRLHTKLFLASIAGSSALVGLMFFLMQWSVDRGLLEYVNTREAQLWKPATEALGEYFQRRGSWEQFERNPRLFHAFLREHADPPSMPSRPPPRPPFTDQGRPPPMGAAQAPPAGILLDGNGQFIVGKSHGGERYHRMAIRSDSQVVGYLAFPRQQRLTDDFELDFLQQQRESFLFISALVLVLSAAFSFPLARHVSRPLRDLAATTRGLTQGKYEQTAQPARQDELGELMRDVDQLSLTLKSNEDARRRWLADTSHELRTPIGIIKGELEAMLDGIRPLETGNLKSLCSEVDHLSRLVDDLHELSNADIGAMRYRMQQLNLTELVSELADSFEGTFREGNMTLVRHLPDHPVLVWGDETRLLQLLGNLLKNSVKYTDAGGTVELRLGAADASAVIEIDDSHPGVPDDSLPRLFDHLYRVEGSRNRDTGGSGLGLAICQRIASAHQGEIEALHSPLGGLKIRLRLPEMK